MLQSIFLPRNIPRSCRRGGSLLHRTVLLGRTAIFGYEENNYLQDSLRASCPVEREEMDVTSRRVSSTLVWLGVVKEIKISSSG
jgi:hypothetical protein